MSCCGQRRSAAAGVGSNETAMSPRRAPVGPPTALPYRAVNLHYIQSEAVHVNGPVTGRRYEFSRGGPVQHVDARDLPGLLETGLFRRGN
jgi:hypothetical protein